ncbi:MAG: long-chain fatty acid--CoA ligase [Pseudomonadota bacterium]
MKGLMTERPLRIADVLEFAAEVHPAAEIVSVRDEGDVHRETYREAANRVAQLAHGLRRLGIKPGDRVATLAWNGYRHFELYYAISGIGAVCHTINPRVPDDQLTYIVEHAGDSLIFADLSLVPILERLAPTLPAGLRYGVLTDAAHAPQSSLELIVYEELLAAEEPLMDWPELPEDTASGLCYTSGTTGEPKGTLYTHRSTVLHALFVSVSLPKILRTGRRILPVVPLFHVNAWGLPYSAPLTGASLVMPGAKLDGPSLFEVMERESVFSAWGVPTVWLGLLAEIEAKGRLPKGLGSIVVGGSAAPLAMVEAFEKKGVDVCHAWGMTEMSPIGTVGEFSDHHAGLSGADRNLQKAKQGRRVFGVELKIVDDDGQKLPHDGKAVGALYARANTVTSGYFRNEAANEAVFDGDGWFQTGDIASIDPDGFLTIADRLKDLIKSGGEWISSIDLENVAMGHPEVANCAVIAVADAKWGERPLLVVVPGETQPSKTEIFALLAEHFAKWQLPDGIVFAENLPLTATGKVSKRTLRKIYAQHVPTDDDKAALVGAMEARGE